MNLDRFDGAPHDPRYTQVDRVIGYRAELLPPEMDPLGFGIPQGNGMHKVVSARPHSLPVLPLPLTHSCVVNRPVPACRSVTL